MTAYLHHHRRIRQLVATRTLRREKFRELPRHRFDTPDRAGLELTAAKLRFHLAADFLPAGFALARINAAVGDDLDLAVGEQQIDQDAVVVLGVPDPQMREHVQRAIAGGLVAEQGCAVERALHDKADLAGMSGLARLDRLLDPIEHRTREDAARPPVVLDQVLADALDAHGLKPHQLPEAPPPPKLPPPPEKPLSLSRELDPELQPLLPPLEKPPDQPPPPRRPEGIAALLAAMMLSAKKVSVETIPPRTRASATEPSRYQPSAPTTTPAAAEPINRPSRLRQIAAMT